MADAQHIRGDTLSIYGTFEIGSFIGWTGKKSQIRLKSTDALLAELEFSWLNASKGQFLLTYSNTQNWAPGDDYVFDVQVKSPDNVVISSRTVSLEVLKDVTRDE